MSGRSISFKTTSPGRVTACCAAFIIRRESGRRPSWCGSPKDGQYIGVELSDENKRQLYIPRGFAHGFAVLSETAQFCYKVDNVYAPQHEATLRYDDPRVGVVWPVKAEEMLLSDKDRIGLGFDEIETFE